MSSWFDDWDREVQEIEGIESVAGFMTALVAIEKPRVEAINLVTGDREFPDDLREKIQGHIALWAISGSLPATDRAWEYATSTRCSRLSMELHDDFHEVARRGISTRFGRLSDSPSQILALRDEYDEETS